MQTVLSHFHELLHLFITTSTHTKTPTCWYCTADSTPTKPCLMSCGTSTLTLRNGNSRTLPSNQLLDLIMLPVSLAMSLLLRWDSLRTTNPHGFGISKTKNGLCMKRHHIKPLPLSESASASQPLV